MDFKKSILGMAAAFCVATAATVAAAEGEAKKDECCAVPQKTFSKALEQVKTLAGRWEGPNPMKPEEKAVVEYKVTAGGSAVLETFSPGQKEEMVSVYHDNPQGRLVMTHYCILGNQPHLNLVNEEPNKLVFSMKGKSGIRDAKEPHMHAITLTWKDQDTLLFKADGYEKGKKKDTCEMTLSRVK